jgi:hypothetical protein
MAMFLDAINSCIKRIFFNLENPLKLKRGTSNQDYDGLKCQECKRKRANFKQCEKCVVTVSQTKMGVCLQFLWYSAEGDTIYCSVDVVPIYKIIKMKALAKARIVNTAMIKQQPEGWRGYMRKYATSDLIFTDLQKGFFEPQTWNILSKCNQNSKYEASFSSRF